ncbi:PPPDE putative peptidase domain-domain-containing protein, partial [Leucosporidium creatinivorum]
MAEPIQLYVYDLSNGLARTLGPQLIGKPLEGIWHTSLVLFGLEVFYGQGISVVSPPGTTHHGTPHKTLDMGSTQLDKETFLSYIEGVREVYSADRYHLLDFNCNSFTNDVLGFLNGRGIPSDILNLPAEILATPFGQSMRPMIDSMFRGRAAPAAADAVRSTFANLPPAGAAPQAPNPSGQSLASNLQICTSTANFHSVLRKSKATAVMFTSKTCPPCEAIKPYFEELARTHSAGTKRIEFVLVEMGVGEGGQVAQSEGVRATPTFVFYSSGKRVGECKGADRGELKTQIQLLEMEVYPAHPHTKLSLPHLTALSRTLAPVTHTAFPALPALSTKLNSILFALTIPAESTTVLTKTVISYLATLPAPPAKPTSPLPPTLLKSWSTATLQALDALPAKDWFPIVDLWRL